MDSSTKKFSKLYLIKPHIMERLLADNPRPLEPADNNDEKKKASKRVSKKQATKRLNPDSHAQWEKEKFKSFPKIMTKLKKSREVAENKDMVSVNSSTFREPHNESYERDLVSDKMDFSLTLNDAIKNLGAAYNNAVASNSMLPRLSLVSTPRATVKTPVSSVQWLGKSPSIRRNLQTPNIFQPPSSSESSALSSIDSDEDQDVHMRTLTLPSPMALRTRSKIKAWKRNRGIMSPKNTTTGFTPAPKKKALAWREYPNRPIN